MGKVAFNSVTPALHAINFHMDGGGREIIENEIKKIIENKGKVNVLEIGCFLGDSSRRWLRCGESVHLIACDFFASGSKIFKNYTEKKVDWACKQLDCYSQDELNAFYSDLDSNDGHLRCFKALMKEYLDRITVFKGDFAENAAEIASSIDVDLIFLDADKSQELLEIAHQYFPNAIMTGDDWGWGAHLGFPIRKAVTNFCVQNNFDFQADKASWIISK